MYATFTSPLKHLLCLSKHKRKAKINTKTKHDMYPLGCTKIKQQEFFFISSFVQLFTYACTMILCLRWSLCRRLDFIPLFCLLFCPYAYVQMWTKLKNPGTEGLLPTVFSPTPWKLKIFLHCTFGRLIQPPTGIESVTFWSPVRCSNHWATRTQLVSEGYIYVLVRIDSRHMYCKSRYVAYFSANQWVFKCGSLVRTFSSYSTLKNFLSPWRESNP